MRASYRPFASLLLLAISIVSQNISVSVPLNSTFTTSEYKDPPSIFGNRIFGMILSFDLTHSDAVEVVLAEYLSMCEAGWNGMIASRFISHFDF